MKDVRERRDDEERETGPNGDERKGKSHRIDNIYYDPGLIPTQKSSHLPVLGTMTSTPPSRFSYHTIEVRLDPGRSTFTFVKGTLSVHYLTKLVAAI